MTDKARTAVIDSDKIEFLDVKLEKVSRIPRGAVASLKGYIDTYNAPGFHRQIKKVIQAGYIRLIFDFSGINYISSTGIGVLTEILKELRSQGGELAFTGLAERVFEVFKLLGFSHFFTINDTLEEAVEMLAVQGRQSEAGTREIFPCIISCPACGKRLKASRSGRFRCAECKTILAIAESGQVEIG